jgi:hypothetical protein
VARVACGPAAALFFLHGFAFRHPPKGEIHWARPLNASHDVPLAQTMAEDACSFGSTDGCRILSSILERQEADELLGGLVHVGLRGTE